MGVNLGSAYGEIEIGTEGAQKSVQSLADTMRGAGQALSLGVTAPLAGVAAMAISSAADFEQSLNIMAQVSGATESQMASLQQQALQLGAETSFSAGEAAAAMLELGKAGLSVEEVGAAIGGTMDLAAAGGLELAQAAEIAANAMNAFNLPADATTDVANMLAAAANASSVEVTDLAAGMTMASAVFASNGQSVEDLTTAMALLGNNAMKGSDAGTSLKTMLMRLTAPTDDAAQAMSSLGINVYDAQGNMRDLPAIMADLQQAMYGANQVTVTHSNLTAEQAQRLDYLKSTIGKTQRQLADYQAGIAGVAQSENDKVVAVDRLNRVLAAAQAEYAKLAGVGGTTSTVMKQLTEEERNAALATIFGADAIRAVNILLSEGQDGWTEMAAAVGQEGAAADVAGARMKGFGGAMEYLKGSIDSFLISTALPFLDNLSGIVRTVADAITNLGNLPQPLKDAALAFGAVLAAAGPVLLALAGIAAVIGFITSPIGLVVLAVAGLAAAWASNFGDIQGKTEAAWTAIRPTLEAFAQYLTAVFEDGDYLNDWLTHMPEAVQPAVLALGQVVAWLRDAAIWLIGALPAALTWLQQQWAAAWPAMQSTWDTVWTVLSAAWTSVQTWLQTDLPAALTSLQTAWDAAWPAIQATWDSTWTVLSGAWTSVQSWLQTDLPAALTSLQAAWDTAWPAIQATWDSTWTALSGAWTSAKAWLDATLPAALTALQTAWDAAWPAMQTAWDTTWTTLSTGFETARTWLETTLPDALTTLQTAFGGVTGGIDALPTALTNAKTQFDAIMVPIGELGDKLSTLFAPALERVQTAFASLPEKLGPLLPKLQEMATAFGGVLTALQPLITAVGAVLAVAALIGVNAFAAAINILPSIVGVVIDQVTASFKLISTVLTEVTNIVKAIIDGDWATVWTSAETIFKAFVIYFRDQLSRFKTLATTIFTAIYDTVTNTLDDLGIDIKPLLDTIKSTWDGVWNTLKDTVQPVIDIVGTVWEKIQQFADFLGGLSLPNPFQALADAAGKVADSVGLGGGKEAKAGGTSYFRGGYTRINERGDEGIILPAGSRVLTNGQTNNLAASQGRSVTINLGGVTIRNDMDLHRLRYELGTMLAEVAG